MTNLYQNYKSNALSTMSPGEILVKLFDETLLQLKHAKILIEKKDMFNTNETLSKVETILSTLNSSLDMQYPISQQLRPMYSFLSQQVLQANIHKDAAIIDNIIPLVRDLRDSFREAHKLNRQGSQSAPVGRYAV